MRHNKSHNYRYWLVLVTSIIIAVGCGGGGGNSQSLTTDRTLQLSVGPNGNVNVPILGTYNDGETVEITATPNRGYAIRGWSGADAVNMANGTATVVMNSDKEVGVEFVWRPTEPPTIQLSNALGTEIELGSVYNLGYSPSGQEAAWMFTIRNTGERPLTLDGIRPIEIGFPDENYDNVMDIWFKISSPDKLSLLMDESITFTILYTGAMYNENLEEALRVHINANTESPFYFDVILESDPGPEGGWPFTLIGTSFDDRDDTSEEWGFAWLPHESDAQSQFGTDFGMVEIGNEDDIRYIDLLIWHLGEDGDPPLIFSEFPVTISYETNSPGAGFFLETQMFSPSSPIIIEHENGTLLYEFDSLAELANMEIQPYWMVWIPISFRPSEPGTYRARMFINSNHPFHPSWQFDVMGHAVGEDHQEDIDFESSNAGYAAAPTRVVTPFGQLPEWMRTDDIISDLQHGTSHAAETGTSTGITADMKTASWITRGIQFPLGDNVTVDASIGLHFIHNNKWRLTSYDLAFGLRAVANIDITIDLDANTGGDRPVLGRQEFKKHHITSFLYLAPSLVWGIGLDPQDGTDEQFFHLRLTAQGDMGIKHEEGQTSLFSAGTRSGRIEPGNITGFDVMMPIYLDTSLTIDFHFWKYELASIKAGIAPWIHAVCPDGTNVHGWAGLAAIVGYELFAGGGKVFSLSSPHYFTSLNLWSDN